MDSQYECEEAEEDVMAYFWDCLVIYLEDIVSRCRI